MNTAVITRTVTMPPAENPEVMRDPHSQGKKDDRNHTGINEVHPLFNATILTHMRSFHQFCHGIHGFLLTHRTLVAAHFFYPPGQINKLDHSRGVAQSTI